MGAWSEIILAKDSIQCYILTGEAMRKEPPRFFKTRAFTKLAARAEISDEVLLKAAADLLEGKGDNLGGNVWKKRLNKNMHRSIVVEKAGDWWIFVFMYAKKDRDNLDQAEERAFKLLAKQYERMTSAQLDDQIAKKELLEIVGHDHYTPIQKRCFRSHP